CPHVSVGISTLSLHDALPILAPALAAAPAWAQHTVIQAENVRYEYAQVLRAEPVYQTLRATGMVERCEQSTLVDPEAGDERRGRSEEHTSELQSRENLVCRLL